MKKPKTAIIWDLDGTLWDSCETVAAAWNRDCQYHGIARSFHPNEIRGYCGKTLSEIAELVFPDMIKQTRESIMERMFLAENRPLSECGGKLFAEEQQVLADLHARYFMAIVSNCGLGYIESFLSGNQMNHFFDDYENAARTGLSKGENIRLVIERNQIDFAVYIGDTSSDLFAAEVASVPFIFAAYGFGDVPNAMFQAERFHDYPDIIARVTNRF